MISLRQLGFTYPGSTLQSLMSISCDFQVGAVTHLLGSNGAGKSTLSYILAGFIPHHYRGELTGDVQIQGESVLSHPFDQRTRQVGMVFQNIHNQFSGIQSTVKEELAFGLENYGTPLDEMQERVERMLDLFQLRGLKDRHPFSLSGGQKQKLAIATMLILNPEILVLDEPTSQLDSKGIKEVNRLLSDLADQGNTLLITSQKVDRLNQVGEAYFLLYQGQLKEEGSFSKLGDKNNLEKFGIRRVGEKFEVDHPMKFPEVDEVKPLEIEFDNVNYIYPGGVEALVGVYLHVQPGTITSVTGENGAGKTTLAKMVMGLLRPNSGQVRVGGDSVNNKKINELAGKVGFLFQHPEDQLFQKTVWQETAFGPDCLGMNPKERDKSVRWALECTGLNHLMDLHPYDLHSSQRSWLAMASILAMRSSILVLDEPTSGQDLFGLKRLYSLLKFLKSKGYTIMLISHDKEFVNACSDKNIQLRGGKVVEIIE